MGCLSLNVIANLERDPTSIVKPLIATASLMSSLQKTMINETIMPPPPTPAITDKDIRNVRITVPIISIVNIGKSPLCTHLDTFISPFDSWHFKYPLYPQSMSDAQIIFTNYS